MLILLLGVVVLWSVLRWTEFLPQALPGPQVDQWHSRVPPKFVVLGQFTIVMVVVDWSSSGPQANSTGINGVWT